MTDELKKLIEDAPFIHSGKFASFMVVPNGQYDGFWGVNGYDNILILARPWNEDKWYKLATEADVFSVRDYENHCPTFNLDIPSQYGVPRIWFERPIEIDYTIPTSTVMGYVKEREERRNDGQKATRNDRR